MTVRITSLLLMLLSSPMVMAQALSEQPRMEPVGVGSLLQIAGSLVFVLLVFGALIMFMRRMSGINPAARGNMKILDGLSLGTRDRIVLLEVGNEQLLLGISPGRIQTLHVMQEKLDTDRSVEPQAFASRLKQVMSGKTTSANPTGGDN